MEQGATQLGRVTVRRIAVLLLAMAALLAGTAQAALATTDSLHAVAALQAADNPPGSTARTLRPQDCAPNDPSCVATATPPRSHAVPLTLGVLLSAGMAWLLVRRRRALGRGQVAGLPPTLFKLYALIVALATLLTVAATVDPHIGLLAILANTMLGLPASLLLAPALGPHPDMGRTAALLLVPVYANLLWLGLMTWDRSLRAQP